MRLPINKDNSQPIESFFKRRQYTITSIAALLSICLSIWAIIVAKQSTRYSEKQYLESLKPVFTSTFTISDSTKELTQIEFQSLKGDLVINNIEYWFPLDFPGEKHGYVNGQTWKTGQIQQELLEYINTVLDMQKNMEYHAFNNAIFPVVLKFSYVQSGLIKSFSGLYEFNFTPYSPSIIRMRHLIFRFEIPKDVSAAEAVEEYNIIYGGWHYDFIESKKFDSVLSLSPKLKKLYNTLRDKCCGIIQHLYFKESDIKDSLILTYFTPNFYEDSSQFFKFRDSVSYFMRFKSDYPKKIQEHIEFVDSMLNENPYWMTQKIALESAWRDEYTYQIWGRRLAYMGIDIYKEIQKKRLSKLFYYKDGF
jgi:hypothetical protein